MKTTIPLSSCGKVYGSPFNVLNKIKKMAKLEDVGDARYTGPLASAVYNSPTATRFKKPDSIDTIQL